jgi:hypothetical protein
MLKNFTSGSLSDIAREKLITSKFKQKLAKDQQMFDRKISQKKSSKKKDSVQLESSKNPFVTTDLRPGIKYHESKQGNLGGRSNSIDITKKMKEKRKKSSEFGGSFAHTASGKNMVRNISDQFSHIKTIKTQPNAPSADMVKILRLNNQHIS